ncbi:9840_t:CDS:2, partial [Entrophospora sp. SA101]
SYANSTLPPPHHTSPDESDSSNWKKLTSITAKQLSTAILVNIFVTGLAGFVLVDLLYAWYQNRYNKHLLNETVEKGTRPEIDVLDDEFIPQPLVSFYHVVCGEHGTGKTTLIRIASREVGQGVIYVDIPSDFGDLGRAINFAFKEKISFTAQLGWKILGETKDKTETPEWKRAMRAFEHAGAVYKSKHNKPPIIVYDNVSRLVYKNLDILQDDAKDNADDRKYIAMFVSSEGKLPQRMESCSAWSRVNKPVMGIGDLSEKESRDYLIQRCTIETKEGNKKNVCRIKKEVDELYKLVGGRIVELNAVVDKFLAGQSLEVIKQQILREVEKKFKTAQLL